MQCDSAICLSRDDFWRSPVTAFVQAVSHTRATRTEIDVFKILVPFCGAALAVYFMWASYGLDLSPGFF